VEAISIIGALFFWKLDFQDTDRLHWCLVFAETGFSGHQSALLVPCFSGNWFFRTPIGFIGALFLRKFGFFGHQSVPSIPSFFPGT
jgi:hypothetical protein